MSRVLQACPLSFPKVEKLVKCLDPNDLGRINFKDFCRGVFAMKGEVLLGALSR
jgi:Rab11 family-interacting protein 3/4